MGRLINKDPILNCHFQIMFTGIATSEEEESFCHSIDFGNSEFKHYTFREAGSLYPISFPIGVSQPVMQLKFFISGGTTIIRWIMDSVRYLAENGPTDALKHGNELLVDCTIKQFSDTDLFGSPVRQYNMFNCLPKSHTPFKTLSTSGDKLAVEELSLYYLDYSMEE